MNITREDMPGRQVALTIELDPETVNSALDKAYRQMVNQYDIPGFRRGKAPRHMLERYVGTEMLTERAVKNILPQTVQSAISDQNIDALDVGDVEIISLSPLQVKVIVVQPPVIEIGDYSGVRVERDPVEITDEQVDQVLTELRRESAPWEEPAGPRPIKEGDMVYLDVEGFTTEGALEEAARENFPTIVGVARAGVPESVNVALADMSVGEEKDIADTLPEDYPNEALRGKDVTYHVTVRSIKSQDLPELDEEFAKKVGYDTVEALRTAVKENLEQRATEAAESKQVNSAMEQIITGASVDVPDMMVKEETDGMLKSLENRLKEQRLNLRQYLTYNGITEAEWREANRERARERVVNNLVLQEFARREQIAVEDADVDAEINTILGRFEGDELTQAQKVLTTDEARNDLLDRLFQQKLLERLTGIAEGRIEAAAPPDAEDDAATEEPADTAGEGTESAQAETPKVAKAGKGSKQAAAQIAEAGTSEEGDTASNADDATGTATDLEAVGGAAEVLGTGDVDLHSPNETGEARGGGTPEDAPGLGK